MDQCARLLFVRGIHEREEVAHGNRLDPGILEPAGGLANGGLIERQENATDVVAALGNLLGEALRSDRRRLRIEIVEQVAVTRLVLDFLYRAIALGNEQPDLGAAHFKQRIGGDCGAVGEKADFVRRDTPGNEFADPIQHAECRVSRRARDLLDQKSASRRVEQHEIGMGAAHIDAKAIAGSTHGGRLRALVSLFIPIEYHGPI